MSRGCHATWRRYSDSGMVLVGTSNMCRQSEQTTSFVLYQG